MSLAGFDLSYTTWADASYALGTISANPGFDYAFVIPVVRQSLTFVPVIRWVVDGIYTRYKLWSTGAEMVPYELYDGQTVPTSASPVLEIWNVQGELTLAMATPWYLTISPLKTPTSLSDVSPTIYPG